MKTYQYDVVIVGAGPAGVSAAGALAGSGLRVALIEAGVYAGAENWSGCVYFAENLAEPDCFGPAAVQNAPFERQVVRRGTLVHNGLDEVGVALTDPAAFRHCYTVLRPVYDPYFADLARSRGITLLAATTVTSLIRKAGRVIGVSTDRGPLYASVVFLAEGDASHLVRSEDLERVREPHYLQGVKAVLSLPAAEIEKRFGLRQGEGAAFEILVRNGAIAGRTAKLNVGGFLYTNRDSLSLGYAVPLDNVKKHFRGDHSRLLEWMRGLPYISDLVRDADLSAYGTKIIRSGGPRERPVLVEDGLAVGGASTNLGIDIPFPNFTGPASASGLYFARAVKALLADGRSLDAKNLTDAYLRPLETSVYGRNAAYLTAWPAYFSRSSVLFGRTADVACGSARFLSSGGIMETGRFLRGHILSVRGIRELVGDTAAALSALRLWKPLVTTILHPATIGSWFANMLRNPAPDERLRLIMNIGGAKADPRSLPRPLGGLLRRVGPSLATALAAVYANDGIPIEKKFRTALRSLFRSLRITDLVVLPLFAFTLFLASVATAVIDAFRFYVLKVPAQKLLAEPVMTYAALQRRARDLDAVRPEKSLEAKLALNTYHVGSRSHIRTLWPGAPASQTAMAQAGLWWVCPARVYSYDAPLFGRGKVTVNWENCIKCESCWRAEPSFALWGRSTDHRLVYRPASAAAALLLEARRELARSNRPLPLPAAIDTRLWYMAPAITGAAKAVLFAASSCREAIGGLPASADSTRRAWPALMGERFCDAVAGMEKLLLAEGRQDAVADLRAEREAIAARFREGRLFPALYAVTRLEQRLLAWIPELTGVRRSDGSGELVPAVSYHDVLKLFPDRIVKQWEEEMMPEEWAGKLRTFIGLHHHPSRPAIRALSSVSPALGLIAACQLRAIRVLAQCGRDAQPGLCAIDADGIAITQRDVGASVRGTLGLVPTAASGALLLITGERAYRISLAGPGVTTTPTRGIGFRAAGLSDITLDCSVGAEDILEVPSPSGSDAASYLAIALGAGDYLSRRAQEHAASRIQFTGQMLDTEGRDGIAKLGAVKAMIARIEAWRLLLETLYDVSRTLSHSPLATPHASLDALFAAAAAMAFGPGNGSLAYDAGQVFGGFAYSEDDLLSRFYRDSALFPFLQPGLSAAGALSAAVEGKDLKELFAGLLGALPASAGRPVSDLVRQWDDVRFWFEKLPRDADPLLRGNAAALVLGTRTMLSAAERSLRAGKSNEAEMASIEVLLGLAEDAVMEAELSAGMGTVAPSAVFPMEPAGGPVALDLDYEAFCALPGPPHRSGSYLVSIFDRSPRYVPEMQLHDRALRERWQELVDWFRKNCRDRTYDGLSFERYVEQQHDLPPAVIDAVKTHKWLATYVPQAEDGLGWRKAGYYALNSAAGSFGDAAVCLLIMASTSIGTTPILLGLEEELPRVREELEPLVRDERALAEIGARLHKLVASFRSPNPAWIRKEYEAVMKLVDARIRRSRVVKYLAANFLRSFYAAGIAGQRGDFGGFMTSMEKASELFGHLMPDVRAGLDELPRRERCHRLYLRTLGHRGVSAFALTEPTAGSDSGGVKTTAQLLSAVLTALPDGRYSFSPAGNGGDLRYLIDADRIVFLDEGMAYRTPDDTAAPIRYDRFDHAASRGARTYEYQGRSCEFHDIGQVRRTEKGLVYEYYSLTGSKMWITNGSLATQFSLFAQAPEGVTGFMVDRYAEGLKVGADERKTGQRGSPTNELALDSVRVPREAVIGYEGHGQVNALETLNVGRCGLAVVAGALSRKVMAEAREHVPQSLERDRLLGEAAAIQFGSESLAYYLIGLFDRPHESVRMESAIAKYLCSEDIHEILALVERSFGPAGQTEKHLIEKARRDARILNIYEGTNEVQRFLILKDLIALAKTWPELPELPTDVRAMTLTRWKNALRKHVRAAADLLGDTAWSDAMLQPGLFRLAELAGEMLRLECTWLRMEWLDARRGLLGADYVDPLLKAGERAAERALARLGHLDRKYHKAWDRISANLLPPEVQAADAVLDRTGRGPADHAAPGPVLTRPMKALCILRPVADLPPSPVLDRGSLREIVWQADPRDRSALDLALDLKASCGSLQVDVLLAGAQDHEGILRTTGASADRLFLLQGDPAEPASIAAAVRELERASCYDLVLCGSRTVDGQAGLAAYLAGRLGRSFARVDRLAVAEDGAGIEGAPIPAVISLTSAIPAVQRALGSLIEAQAREIRTLGPAATAPRRITYAQPRAAAQHARTVTTVQDAAEFLKTYAASQTSARAEAFTGQIGAGSLPTGPMVWPILDPAGKNANVAVLRAAKSASGHFGRNACALVAAPRSLWQTLLGLAKANGTARAFCLDTGDGLLSGEGRRHLLRALLAAGSPMIAVSNEWNDACAFVAGEAEERSVALCTDITDLGRNSDGCLDLSVSAYDGKLLREERLEDGSAFMTFAPNAELPPAAATEQFSASQVDFAMDARWTTPLPPETEPTLAEADVIIDIGYGVRDSSGMELAKELGKKLEALGLAPLFGATRKVTQDLKLLPLDAQIGQTGVRVNPKLIIALGISGAPQHVDWIGTRADVLCFNKDAEAPLMKLNQTRPAPRVHPIPGDLFVTVRELIERLG